MIVLHMKKVKVYLPLLLASFCFECTLPSWKKNDLATN